MMKLQSMLTDVGKEVCFPVPQSVNVSCQFGKSVYCMLFLYLPTALGSLKEQEYGLIDSGFYILR